MDTERHTAHGRDDPPEACDLCARRAEEAHAVLTWTLDSSDDRWSWICPDCSRDHVRDIEARLDKDWW